MIILAGESANKINNKNQVKLCKPQLKSSPLRLALPLFLALLSLGTFATNSYAADKTVEKYSVQAFSKKLKKLYSTQGHQGRTSTFRDFLDMSWIQSMHENPEFATSVGYPGLNGLWTDNSQAAFNRRQKELDDVDAALKSINKSKLSKVDQQNYDLFRYDLDRQLESRQFHDEYLQVNQLGGVQQDLAQMLTQNPTQTLADYEDILSRLRGMPLVIEQSIDWMKKGIATGITYPKVILRDVPDQIRAQIVKDPLMSPLYEPFKHFPQSISEASQKNLTSRAQKLISAEVIPAYSHLLDFFTQEYIPKAREEVAWSKLPNGEAWYKNWIKFHTTTSMSAQEIHDLGLSEVKRIRVEMEKIITELKFKGDFAAFSKFLREDPQFYFTNKDDLLHTYRDIAKRIDGELPKLFLKLPRNTYGVKPVPEYAEKSQTTAYYEDGSIEAGRAGFFFANTYDLKSRPKWEMEALTLHEAVPGHHLQLSLAEEMDVLPDFRKHEFFTAFIEGWGLYSESLGKDLGMYQDPYSRYGQLTYENLRAIRLVIDTGIHALGWSRQQALDYFKANSSQADHDMVVETDRYIAWPGQALAYKIGELKFKSLKEKARNALGEKFDIRRFHDALLQNGSLPMQVVENNVDQWIKDESNRKATLK